jgi:hypothetical protein
VSDFPGEPRVMIGDAMAGYCMYICIFILFSRH